jgi:hypothetical protein
VYLLEVVIYIHMEGKLRKYLKVNHREEEEWEDLD